MLVDLVIYPALIVRANGGTIHHGALAAARTLGRLGASVYAVVPRRWTPVSASHYVRGTFVWKSWPRDRASFLDAMSEIGNSIGRPSVLFPMDDLSAIFAAENTAELARWFVLPQVKTQVPRQLADKIHLHALCSKVGISVPRTVVPHSIEDVVAFSQTSQFPVVVKAAEQWTLLHDRFSTHIVSSPKELVEFYNELENIETSRSILQEYVEGEDWIAHGYCNSEKGIYLTFTGRKLLAYPARAGSTAVGLSVPNDTLRCLTENLLRFVGYSGIVDTDWRRDKRDGQYKLLDCNPRMGQNFRMFENGAGIDVVRAQYLDLTGQRIENAPMLAGRRFSVESFRLLTALRGSYRPDRIDVNEHPAGRSRELAWWSGDDPLPFLVMAARMPLSLIRRRYRRAAKRLLSVRHRFLLRGKTLW